jgi:hypothetical protein
MTHNDLRYEFGPYQLNPSKRILTRDGEGIPLTPKDSESKDLLEIQESITRHLLAALKLRLTERCGDHEGAGLALLMMFVEVNDALGRNEKNHISNKLKRLLGTTQQSALRARVEK